jgi:hypothetical protein
LVVVESLALEAVAEGAQQVATGVTMFLVLAVFLEPVVTILALATLESEQAQALDAAQVLAPALVQDPTPAAVRDPLPPLYPRLLLRAG